MEKDKRLNFIWSLSVISRSGHSSLWHVWVKKHRLAVSRKAWEISVTLVGKSYACSEEVGVHLELEQKKKCGRPQGPETLGFCYMSVFLL